MTVEVLGHEPLKRKALFSAGADYVLRVQRTTTDPAITSGTLVDFIIYDDAGEVETTWTANEVTEDYAYWEVESDLVDPIPAGYTYRIYVRYPRGDSTYLDQLWIYGPIQRKE